MTNNSDVVGAYTGETAVQHRKERWKDKMANRLHWWYGIVGMVTEDSLCGDSDSLTKYDKTRNANSLAS